ncbi:MAG: hypothetical protein Q9174_002577, partial [Haloplaca sp. 1 TL-2023]
MDSEAEHRPEVHDLGSWHPAHMPESSLQENHSQSTDSTSRKLPRNYDFEAFSPRYVPSVETPMAEDSRFHTEIEPTAIDRTGVVERSPSLEASEPTGDSSRESESHVGEDSSHTGPDASLEVPNDSNDGKQNTGIVNGLSFSHHDPNDDPDFSREIHEQLGFLDRSNSFPAVPPLHQTRKLDSQTYGQSQVESILEQDEEISDMSQQRYDSGEPQLDNMAKNPLGRRSGDEEDNDHENFVGFAADADVGDVAISPPDDEARFEEGLPLVQSGSFSLDPPEEQPSSPMDQPSEDPTATDQDFFGQDVSSEFLMEDSTDPDQDFFAQNPRSSQEDASFKPAALDRKSTSQVLQSMSFPPQHITHDAPALQADAPSLPDVPGGESIGSSSPETSHVDTEGTFLAEKLPEKGLGQEPEQTDEDLAAMWQAALDDDDLLDDSETPAGEPSLDHTASTPYDTQASSGPATQTQRFGNVDLTSNSAVKRYSPASGQQSQPQVFQNHMPMAGQQMSGPSASYLSHSVSAPGGFGQAVAQQSLPNNVSSNARPAMPKPAQSFADKSKGGYTSPYDLPMDVSRPKRRTNLQQVQNASNSRISPQPPPPPRSTSMYAAGSPVPDQSPPLPPLPSNASALPPNRPSSSSVRTKPSVGSFFEELPPTTKSRPSSAGKYAPAAPQHLPGQIPPRPEAARPPPSVQRPPLTSSNTTPNFQLAPPERHSPYANLPQHDKTSGASLQAASRYSPAPGQPSNVPPSRNRYAASPGVGPRPAAPPQTTTFQPRTSSPLAQDSSLQQQPFRKGSLPNGAPERPPPLQRNMTAQRYQSNDHAAALPQLEERFEPSVGRNVPRTPLEEPAIGAMYTQGNNQLSPSGGSGGPYRSSPSGSAFTTLTPESESMSTSPHGHSQYPVQSQPEPQPQMNIDDAKFEPPRRSQTQSPGAIRPRPEAVNRMQAVYQRPASAIGGQSHVRAEPPYSSSYTPAARNEHVSRGDVQYIRPVDGRESDPLERWKGAPIFKFGFGGHIVTSFPKHIPRYAAGHAFPMINCSPGEVKLRLGNVGTLDSDIAKFPGPLKSKSKKKELLGWLQQKIASLENSRASIAPSYQLPDPSKRHEEKILLWKTMHVLIEHDGAITHNAKAESAVRTLLSPESSEGEVPEQTSAGLAGHRPSISKPDGSHPIGESTDAHSMESVRRLLLQGEREKAVWLAVDRRMWAHAMVLASTLEKKVWKQVLHEFTRLEVKPFGENTESLAAVYEVFAGNWEESIDELVPPSARAGLQMVSKAASTGPTRNALDGLDKWQETLALILSNRTPEDESALAALGRLLAGYGRTEAAHICLIFAKSATLFGASDDSQQAAVVLLGADHQQQPLDFGRDLDSILLTEVYEFGRAVLAPTATLSVSPHLQSYKLYHAMLLAEHGYRVEAQQYCDAVLSTLKSTTKPSPYYHSLLFTSLDDLLERLQQAPRDGSSWMSKPMDKVSGSMWKKFNNFIAGDESDTASVASGKGEQDAGPFARVTPDPSSISRSESTTDLYGAYGSSNGPPPPAATALGSRYAPSSHYAPAAQYTPRSSFEQHGRSSEESYRPSQSSGLRPVQSQNAYSSNASRYASSPANLEGTPSTAYTPNHQSSPYVSQQPATYLPTPPTQPDSMAPAPNSDPSASPYPHESYQSDSPLMSQAPPYQRSSLEGPYNNTFEAPQSSYNPSVSAYEPPSSYTPYSPGGHQELSPTEPKSPKKKKSFMYDDDDDDFNSRASAVLKDEKARKDKDADDAFRKAAEADAQKDLKPKKSGWFGGVGGWLGGSKKDEQSLNHEPKAIKAKLGEESSFFYDKELKKWVNKKDPAPSTTEAPKAPPPRGPPSRAVSAAGGPPPSMSRTATPPVPPLPPSMMPAQGPTPPMNVTQSTPPTNHNFPSGPPSGVGTPARTASPAGLGADLAPSSGPPSAPPSRPSTAVGGASKGSDIDDLLGEPQ